VLQRYQFSCNDSPSSIRATVKSVASRTLQTGGLNIVYRSVRHRSEPFIVSHHTLTPAASKRCKPFTVLLVTLNLLPSYSGLDIEHGKWVGPREKYGVDRVGSGSVLIVDRRKHEVIEEEVRSMCRLI
jgi:hypothetical protein